MAASHKHANPAFKQWYFSLSPSKRKHNIDNVFRTLCRAGRQGRIRECVRQLGRDCSVSLIRLPPPPPHPAQRQRRHDGSVSSDGGLEEWVVEDACTSDSGDFESAERGLQEALRLSEADVTEKQDQVTRPSKESQDDNNNPETTGFCKKIVTEIITKVQDVPQRRFQEVVVLGEHTVLEKAMQRTLRPTDLDQYVPEKELRKMSSVPEKKVNYTGYKPIDQDVAKWEMQEAFSPSVQGLIKIEFQNTFTATESRVSDRKVQETLSNIEQEVPQKDLQENLRPIQENVSEKGLKKTFSRIEQNLLEKDHQETVKLIEQEDMQEKEMQETFRPIERNLQENAQDIVRPIKQDMQEKDMQETLRPIEQNLLEKDPQETISPIEQEMHEKDLQETFRPINKSCPSFEEKRLAKSWWTNYTSMCTVNIASPFFNRTQGYSLPLNDSPIPGHTCEQTELYDVNRHTSTCQVNRCKFIISQTRDAPETVLDEQSELQSMTSEASLTIQSVSSMAEHNPSTEIYNFPLPTINHSLPISIKHAQLGSQKITMQLLAQESSRTRLVPMIPMKPPVPKSATVIEAKSNESSLRTMEEIVKCDKYEANVQHTCSPVPVIEAKSNESSLRTMEEIVKCDKYEANVQHTCSPVPVIEAKYNDSSLQISEDVSDIYEPPSLVPVMKMVTQESSLQTSDKIVTSDRYAKPPSPAPPIDAKSKDSSLQISEEIVKSDKFASNVQHSCSLATVIEAKSKDSTLRHAEEIVKCDKYAANVQHPCSPVPVIEAKSNDLSLQISEDVSDIYEPSSLVPVMKMISQESSLQTSDKIVTSDRYAKPPSPAPPIDAKSKDSSLQISEEIVKSDKFASNVQHSCSLATVIEAKSKDSTLRHAEEIVKCDKYAANVQHPCSPVPVIEAKSNDLSLQISEDVSDIYEPSSLVPVMKMISQESSLQTSDKIVTCDGYDEPHSPAPPIDAKSEDSSLQISEEIVKSDKFASNVQHPCSLATVIEAKSKDSSLRNVEEIFKCDKYAANAQHPCSPVPVIEAKSNDSSLQISEDVSDIYEPSSLVPVMKMISQESSLQTSDKIVTCDRYAKPHSPAPPIDAKSKDSSLQLSEAIFISDRYVKPPSPALIIEAKSKDSSLQILKDVASDRYAKPPSTTSVNKEKSKTVTFDRCAQHSSPAPFMLTTYKESKVYISQSSDAGTEFEESLETQICPQSTFSPDDTIKLGTCKEIITESPPEGQSASDESEDFPLCTPGILPVASKNVPQVAFPTLLKSPLRTYTTSPKRFVDETIPGDPVACNYIEDDENIVISFESLYKNQDTLSSSANPPVHCCIKPPDTSDINIVSSENKEKDSDKLLSKDLELSSSEEDSDDDGYTRPRIYNGFGDPVILTDSIFSLPNNRGKENSISNHNLKSNLIKEENVYSEQDFVNVPSTTGSPTSNSTGEAPEENPNIVTKQSISSNQKPNIFNFIKNNVNKQQNNSAVKDTSTLDNCKNSSKKRLLNNLEYSNPSEQFLGCRKKSKTLDKSSISKTVKEQHEQGYEIVHPKRVNEPKRTSNTKRNNPLSGKTCKYDKKISSKKVEYLDKTKNVSKEKNYRRDVNKKKIFSRKVEYSDKTKSVSKEKTDHSYANKITHANSNNFSPNAVSPNFEMLIKYNKTLENQNINTTGLDKTSLYRPSNVRRRLTSEMENVYSISSKSNSDSLSSSSHTSKLVEHKKLLPPLKRSTSVPLGVRSQNRSAPVTNIVLDSILEGMNASPYPIKISHLSNTSTRPVATEPFMPCPTENRIPNTEGLKTQQRERKYEHTQFDVNENISKLKQHQTNPARNVNDKIRKSSKKGTQPADPFSHVSNVKVGQLLNTSSEVDNNKLKTKPKRPSRKVKDFAQEKDATIQSEHDIAAQNNTKETTSLPSMPSLLDDSEITDSVQKSQSSTKSTVEKRNHNNLHDKSKTNGATFNHPRTPTNPKIMVSINRAIICDKLLNMCLFNSLNSKVCTKLPPSTEKFKSSVSSNLTVEQTSVKGTTGEKLLKPCNEVVINDVNKQPSIQLKAIKPLAIKRTSLECNGFKGPISANKSLPSNSSTVCNNLHTKEVGPSNLNDNITLKRSRQDSPQDITSSKRRPSYVVKLPLGHQPVKVNSPFVSSIKPENTDKSLTKGPPLNEKSHKEIIPKENRPIIQCKISMPEVIVAPVSIDATCISSKSQHDKVRCANLQSQTLRRPLDEKAFMYDALIRPMSPQNVNLSRISDASGLNERSLQSSVSLNDLHNHLPSSSITNELEAFQEDAILTTAQKPSIDVGTFTSRPLSPNNTTQASSLPYVNYHNVQSPTNKSPLTQEIGIRVKDISKLSPTPVEEILEVSPPKQRRIRVVSSESLLGNPIQVDRNATSTWYVVPESLSSKSTNKDDKSDQMNLLNVELGTVLKNLLINGKDDYLKLVDIIDCIILDYELRQNIIVSVKRLPSQDVIEVEVKRAYKEFENRLNERGKNFHKTCNDLFQYLTETNLECKVLLAIYISLSEKIMSNCKKDTEMKYELIQILKQWLSNESSKKVFEQSESNFLKECEDLKNVLDFNIFPESNFIPDAPNISAEVLSFNEPLTLTYLATDSNESLQCIGDETERTTTPSSVQQTITQDTDKTNNSQGISVTPESILFNLTKSDTIIDKDHGKKENSPSNSIEPARIKPTEPMEYTSDLFQSSTIASQTFHSQDQRSITVTNQPNYDTVIPVHQNCCSINNNTVLPQYKKIINNLEQQTRNSSSSVISRGQLRPEHGGQTNNQEQQKYSFNHQQTERLSDTVNNQPNSQVMSQIVNPGKDTSLFVNSAFANGQHNSQISNLLVDNQQQISQFTSSAFYPYQQYTKSIEFGNQITNQGRPLSIISQGRKTSHATHNKVQDYMPNTSGLNSNYQHIPNITNTAFNSDQNVNEITRRAINPYNVQTNQYSMNQGQMRTISHNMIRCSTKRPVEQYTNISPIQNMSASNSFMNFGGNPQVNTTLMQEYVHQTHSLSFSDTPALSLTPVENNTRNPQLPHRLDHPKSAKHHMDANFQVLNHPLPYRNQNMNAPETWGYGHVQNQLAAKRKIMQHSTFVKKAPDNLSNNNNSNRITVSNQVYQPHFSGKQLFGQAQQNLANPQTPSQSKQGWNNVDGVPSIQSTNLDVIRNTSNPLIDVDESSIRQGRPCINKVQQYSQFNSRRNSNELLDDLGVNNIPAEDMARLEKLISNDEIMSLVEGSKSNECDMNSTCEMDSLGNKTQPQLVETQQVNSAGSNETDKTNVTGTTSNSNCPQLFNLLTPATFVSNKLLYQKGMSIEGYLQNTEKVKYFLSTDKLLVVEINNIKLTTEHLVDFISLFQDQIKMEGLPYGNDTVYTGRFMTTDGRVFSRAELAALSKAVLMMAREDSMAVALWKTNATHLKDDTVEQLKRNVLGIEVGLESMHLLQSLSQLGVESATRGLKELGEMLGRRLLGKTQLNDTIIALDD